MKVLFCLLIMNAFTIDPPKEVDIFAASMFELYRREGFEPKPYKGPEGGRDWFIGYGTLITSKADLRRWRVTGITKPEARQIVYDKYEKEYQMIYKQFGRQYSKNVLLAFTNLCYNVGYSKFSKSGTFRHLKAGRLSKALQVLKTWTKYKKDGVWIDSDNLKQSRLFDYYLGSGNYKEVARMASQNKQNI